MKKFFATLSLALLTAAGSQAADFLTVTVDGTTVKDGDVIISSELDTYEEDGMVWWWDIKPDFQITSSEDASYSMKIANSGETGFSYCGITLASENSLSCQQIAPGNDWTDIGKFQAGRSYPVVYDYQHSDLNNLPTSIECKGDFVLEATAASGKETLTFSVNMIWPGDNKVEGLDEENFTIIAGNGRIESTDGRTVEVYDLSGTRVANEGLKGLYIARIGNRAIKTVVR